jgi:SAM-dependent methyltransferase
MDGRRLQTIREDYNRIADEYADHICKELDHKPFDRALLLRFAVAAGRRGAICDMGCGPGHVSRFLRDAGADVFGLDLSPRMVEKARRLNPGLQFREGNMLSLDLPDGGLAGVVAFYAIVNIPRESLPTVFEEMHRVLKPGGLLLLAFHVGEEIECPGELWGQPVSLEFFFHQSAAIRQLLTEAGFSIKEVAERGPYAPEVEYQSNRAYIFACKPETQAR